jgi:putative ABC transport system ATP-binding protein
MLLEVLNVGKVYDTGAAKVVALADTSLKLGAGTLSGIIGPSGSGKTTLLMISGLLEPPSTGEVRFEGRLVSHPKAHLNELRDFRRKHIGFVFQKANLIPFLSAAENVAIALEINDADPVVARDKSHELLDKLGLGHRLDNYPSQLSGGEQQRVSIARALANDPKIILADEPTAALDGRRAQQVMELFSDLAKRQQVAICVVTHDARWNRFFDTMLELEDGRPVVKAEAHA